jgi:hypothetical protein
MRKRDRMVRSYIRYKTAPLFLVFWMAAGAFAWAILLYATTSLGRYAAPILRAFEQGVK